MAVVLVYRRTEETGRKLGFMEVTDKLAEKLIKKGVAKMARKNRKGGVTPLKTTPAEPEAPDPSAEPKPKISVEPKPAPKPAAKPAAPVKSGKPATDKDA